MKNIGILLLVVLCIVSCKKDEEPVTEGLGEITQIRYSVVSDIDDWKYNYVSIFENTKIASIQDWNFSGGMYTKTCDQSFDSWTELMELVGDDFTEQDDENLVLGNFGSFEKITIMRSLAFYTVDFESSDDLGEYEELMLALRAEFESMNGCQ